MKCRAQCSYFSMLLLSDATNGDLSNELYSDKKKKRCHYAVESRKQQTVGAAEIPRKKSYKITGGKKNNGIDSIYSESGL